MKKNLIAAYFSPTGGTRRTALEVAQGMSEEVEELDLSLPEDREYEFGKDDAVIFAAPVFGGRIPAYMADKLKRCKGNGAVAIVMAVYGNRAYEDALVELRDLLSDQGFTVAAGVAAVAEHSIVRSVAAGRPDGPDCEALAGFGRAIARKIEEAEQEGGKTLSEPEIPGNRPYKEWTPMQAVPEVSDDCIECGLCASKCPAQAIPEENTYKTDPAKCMLCMRCIKNCPTGARALPAAMTGMLEQKLSPLAGVRRENEVFL